MKNTNCFFWTYPSEESFKSMTSVLLCDEPACIFYGIKMNSQSVNQFKKSTFQKNKIKNKIKKYSNWNEVKTTKSYIQNEHELLSAGFIILSLKILTATAYFSVYLEVLTEQPNESFRLKYLHIF